MARGRWFVILPAVCALIGVTMLPFRVDAANGPAVTGQVQQVAGPSDYARSGGSIFAVPRSDVDRFMPGAHYYEVQGRVLNGKWDYSVSVPTQDDSVTDVILVGVNNVRHTQLLAVGSPASTAPGRMLSRTYKRLLSSRRTPSFQEMACYANRRQLQGITTWYEYVPNNYPATEQEVQVTTSEVYYYSGTDINCQSGNDALSNNGIFTPISGTHSFIAYIDSGPKAVAATNVSYTGTDLLDDCITIDINGQTVYGSASGTGLASVNTHAYYCGTSTQPSQNDWFYDQILNQG